jgi:hypothetical protein
MVAVNVSARFRAEPGTAGLTRRPNPVVRQLPVSSRRCLAPIQCKMSIAVVCMPAGALRCYVSTRFLWKKCPTWSKFSTSRAASAAGDRLHVDISLERTRLPLWPFPISRLPSANCFTENPEDVGRPGCLPRRPVRRSLGAAEALAQVEARRAKAGAW